MWCGVWGGVTLGNHETCVSLNRESGKSSRRLCVCVQVCGCAPARLFSQLLRGQSSGDTDPSDTPEYLTDTCWMPADYPHPASTPQPMLALSWHSVKLHLLTKTQAAWLKGQKWSHPEESDSILSSFNWKQHTCNYILYFGCKALNNLQNECLFFCNQHSKEIKSPHSFLVIQLTA